MRFLCTVIAALVLIGTGALHAHEGHDHGAPSAPVNANAAPRGEAATDSFELVAIVQGGELALFIDRFQTNEPVENAKVEVETPSGPVAAAAHAGDAYRLKAPFLSKPGRYDLLVTVTAGDATEILPVSLTVPEARPAPAQNTHGWSLPGLTSLLITSLAAFGAGIGFAAMWRRRTVAAMTVVVVAGLAIGSGHARAHEGEDHSQPAAIQTQGDAASRLPDGSIFVPKATQRIFSIRTVQTAAGAYRRTTELPGRIIPDPNASGYVQAATGGRLSAPAGGFPQLGTMVKEGDVLAYVTPPIQAIDVSDMRQRQGELDQQISIVERRLARYEALAPSGAISRTQLEETRLEMQGLKDRRSALDRSRRDPEALMAPVSGVVADGSAIAGQMAQSNAVIFHIIDPARLWVEALSFAPIAGGQLANAKTGSGQILKLSYKGSGFADRSQSIPVHFSIEDNLSGLRAGQFVTVLVSTEEEKKGIAVPRTALVRSANGQDMIFEHTAAEVFVPRQVRTEPLDGEHVLVQAGIGPGKRIVTQGSELLDHVR
jgi:RND family efflux transporter MFP subunit